MSNSARPREKPTDADRREAGLDDVPDGCGCVEIWERLSEERTEDDRA